MKRFLTAILLCLPLVAGARVHNVRDYGAMGDGKAIDSPAINKAIEAAAGEGGGQVYVPAGTYLCYSIRLASGIDFHMEKGAVIKAGAEPKYDLAEPGPEPQFQDYGHSHWKNSLFWGIGLNNFTISGEGFIDGTDLSGGYGDTAVQKGVANKAISLKNCTNVILKDFTVLDGGHFCLLATGVDNLLLRDVTVDTRRDGFDIDCCRNVRIYGCNVNSPWDDGIVLKASYGLDRFKDTENVTISDCNISGFLNGTMLDNTNVRTEGIMNPHTKRVQDHRSGGRIKLGTESSGGFKNIAITNCTFDYSGGLLIESMDGGIVEDIVVTNLTMRNCFDCPIFFRLGARMRSPKGTPVGTIKRVTITNVNAWNNRSTWPMMITGIPGHKVEDVVLRDIRINYAGGCTKEEAQKTIPENEKTYPDPWMFSRKPDDPCNSYCLPYRALMLRHVNDVRMDNVKFSFNAEDTRTDFFIEDATNVRATEILVQGTDRSKAFSE